MMEKEYDFSQAEKGKFFRPLDKLEIPIYLDKKVKDYYIALSKSFHLPRSSSRRTALSKFSPVTGTCPLFGCCI